jgi:hypothetical protein
MKEGVSGLRLNGEASMLPFLSNVNWEENISKMFKTFATRFDSEQHCPNDESVRQNSLTSSSLHSSPDDVLLENPPRASFVASILDFLTQITKMDNVGSHY